MDETRLEDGRKPDEEATFGAASMVGEANRQADRWFSLNRPFTITVHNVFGNGPERFVRMGQRNRVSVENKNVRFVRPPASDRGRMALNLVNEAATVFSGMEDHVRETEAHAELLCRSAAERVKVAEQQLETVEREQLEMMQDVNFRLQDASKALAQAQSRCTEAENKLAAMELRVQAAEADARKATETLALVEDAIRKQLLCAGPEAVGRLKIEP
jgi:hypothetical protein